ncbi:putative late blight resistance protein homolog R1C-3 [Solanum stenotomum]|uniref:putative late blight resistance protein homolog R1C-3 n=1 Tax=Solanum stenotomum TaxID=172797 RepID=UPI0020D0A82D|nr:putative late blight resistance protein homolog R1C-3 [Solanum stenotomum]
MRKLTCGPADLDVISITGMPGSSKTTLAYKVYNDKSVSSHFDLRAWCTVDQEHDEKKLLGTIFNQVSNSNSKLSENLDVADKLRRQLYGKRFLIVLDDVWVTTTWDELTRPFPEVKKGSRIILTTREQEVTLHGKVYTDPLNLRLLKPEETWELLEKRAFGNESFPNELLDVGKVIAHNCKGLPLVVDLISGVIVGRERKRLEVEVMKVIELSYVHLLHQGKPCFLYLASFPKDRPIIISELIDVWRAEGLVEQTEKMSVEEVMKVYLDNLIYSSLLTFFNEMGDYPTCQLHDLVHDFCLIKARKEKLFDKISSSSPSSSSDLMPRIVNIHYNRKFFGLNNFLLFGSNEKGLSGKHMYSLGIIGDHRFDTFHLRHLRLLRALYLDPSFIMVKDSLLNEICMLNHLRYLRIGTEVIVFLKPLESRNPVGG